MAWSNRVTGSLGIEYPVLLAPMDLVASGQLASAVSQAGGLGLIGGGYGNAEWLEREFAAAGNARVGCGFITEVPVVASGGIADGRGLAAVMMLGAEGVLMGTRFYASQEAQGHPEAKQRIVEASGDDTLRSIVFDISRRNIWPQPYTGRVIRNRHAEQWYGRETELLEQQEEEANRYGEAREHGNFDVAAVIAGEAVGLIRDAPPAAEIVARIVREAETLLSRRAQV